MKGFGIARATWLRKSNPKVSLALASSKVEEILSSLPPENGSISARGYG
jgi:hypothetical protein